MGKTSENRNLAGAVFRNVNLHKVLFDDVNVGKALSETPNLKNVSIVDANIDGLTICDSGHGAPAGHADHASGHGAHADHTGHEQVFRDRFWVSIGDGTALAGIMRLLEQAQQSKSGPQIVADKAAGWPFYIALLVAAITVVAWLLAVGPEIDVLQRAVTVLLIACPYALGLAIPLVVTISTSMGAGNGILVRDRLAPEEAREANTAISCQDRHADRRPVW